MNAAVRVISGTRTFDRGLTRLLHENVHWLDIAQRITFKLSAGVQVFAELGKIPRCTIDLDCVEKAVILHSRTTTTL